MVVDFKKISENSRIWVYQLNKELSDFEANYLSKQTGSFLDSWAAHGTGLIAAFTLVKNRFLIVAADESKANASGCSIDSLTHFLKDMQQQMEIDFFDRSAIIYNETGKIESMPFVEFKEKITTKELSDDVLMYNTVLQQKSQLVNQFEIPVKESWLMGMI